MVTMVLYKAGLVSNVASEPDYPVEPLDFTRMQKYYAARGIHLELASTVGTVQGISKECKKCLMVAPVDEFKYTRVVDVTEHNLAGKTVKTVANYCQPCWVVMNTDTCVTCGKLKGAGHWIRKKGTRHLRCAACIQLKGFSRPKQDHSKTYRKQG